MNSSADDLICVADLAADFLGVSSSGGLDYWLSSGPRVELDNTVTPWSTVIAARNERVRVPLLHHFGGQQAIFFGLCCPMGCRCSVLRTVGAQRGGMLCLSINDDSSGFR